ncbi:MAG: PKD domain-containing protein [Bacteroidetes bacterium]|nr:PKD domain-containing protein [Bacteroidota bacterium]
METKYFRLLMFLLLISAFTKTFGQANLDSGLVACYTFKGDANDHSGNNNNGVVTGATLASDRFGNSNSAYLFNGSTDHIAISNFNNLISKNELTISLWAKATSLTSNCPILLSPDASSDRCVACVQYVASPSAVIWDYGNIFSGGRTFIDGITYQSKWDHYVFIVSQSKNIKKVFKNNVQISSTAYTSSLTNKNRTLFIGGGTDASGGDIGFTGYLDDILIFDRAITASEVDELFNYPANSCIPTANKLDSGLVACFPFKGDANDYSGNNRNGVVNGASLAPDRFGNSNSAYLFNGSSDNIAVNNFNNLISQNELSISLWAKATSLTSNAVFMLSPDNTADRLVGAVQYIASPSAIFFDYGDIFNNGRTMINGITYKSAWDHYVFIISQSKGIKKIYKNDSVVSSTAYTSSLINRNKTLLIGGGTDASLGDIHFTGYIDDILIYNRAITASEIDQIYKGYTCSSAFSASPTSVCQGDSVQFTDNNKKNPTNWKWTFSGGNPSTSALKNPKISYPAAGSYDVVLIVTDSVGIDTITYKKYITVLSPPTPSITVNGGNTFCSGTGSLSSNYSSGNQWLFNGNPITGATAQNYYPTQTGFYTLKKTDANGCTAISNLASVTVLPKPTAGVNAANNTICNGQSTNLNGTGDGTYTWSTAETTSSIMVSPGATTTYTLTVTGSNSCTATATQTITVNPVPPVPTILQNGSLLASSASTGNQWNLNGSPIGGATGQFYTPTVSGFYSVTVTNGFGCSSTSTILNFTLTGINNLSLPDAYINIYPNPSDGYLNIDFGSALNERMTVTIFNTLGEVVYSKNILPGNKLLSVNLSGVISDGIYTLMLQNNSGRRIEKVVFAE